MNPKITLALTSLLLLTACGASTTIEKAANAMAETACLHFNEGLSREELEAQSLAILEKYTYATAAEIDGYLLSIQGTEELNAIASTLRDALKSNCGGTLEAKGVAAEDLANAMVSE